jgi:predicted MFS family arabinose efflux permease
MSTITERSGTTSTRTGYRSVLAEPRFRLLLLTRALGITGDSLRISTFSVLVYAGTGSPLLSAFAFGAGFLPQAFGSVLLGSLADRLAPRALIVGGYLLEAVAAAVLGLTRMPIVAGLVLVALVALATPAFNGASARLVAHWLTGDAYVLGRSLNNIVSSGAQLCGLALGGAAATVLGAHSALAVGALMYLLCAAAIRLRLPKLAAEHDGGEGGAIRDSLRGTRSMLGERRLRRLLFAQWLPCAFVTGAEGLIVPYAAGRDLPAGSYALLMACVPIGMLLGDLVVGRLLRPASRERLVVPLIVVMGVPLLGFAAEPGRLTAGVLLLLSGFGFSFGLGLQRPFLAAVPAKGQGQAFGLLGSGTMTLEGLGPACAGALATVTSTGAAIAIAGVCILLTAAWVFGWTNLRVVRGPGTERCP